jgi:hypothetical protein
MGDSTDSALSGSFALRGRDTDPASMQLTADVELQDSYYGGYQIRRIASRFNLMQGRADVDATADLRGGQFDVAATATPFADPLTLRTTRGQFRHVDIGPLLQDSTQHSDLNGTFTTPDTNGGPTTDGEREREYDGLYDGEAILGEETDADAGDDDLDAVVGGSPGNEGDGTDFDQGYDSGGFSSDASYDAQQAGFSRSDDVENADIIREYNLRIRDGGDSDSDQ